MFIKGSEDIFILKLLHPRFAVSPSPVVFVFCAPFFSHHQSAAANGCSFFSQKFPPVQKELFLPTLAAQRESLHFSIMCWSETLLHLGNLHSGKAKLMAFWTYQFIRPLSFLVLIY